MHRQESGAYLIKKAAAWIVKPYQAIRQSLFSKLLFAFLIMIVPIFVIGISIYTWGQSTVKNEIVSKKSSQISYDLKQLEDDINSIKLMQYEYLLDYKLIFLHNLTSDVFDYTKRDTIVKIRDELLSMQNSRSLIDEIVVFFPQLDKKISSRTGLEPMTEDDHISYRSRDLTTPANLYSAEQALLINAQYPLYTTTERRPFFSVRIELEKTAILNWLRQFDYYDTSGSFIIWDRDGFPNLSTGDQDLSLFISQQVLAGATGHAVTTQSIKKGKERYLVTIAHSEFFGFSVVSYVSEAEIFQNARVAQTRVMVFVIASVIILLLFIIFLERMLQHPMKKLLNAFKRVDDGMMDFQIDSRRTDEFKVLYNQFNSMIKAIHGLIEHNYKQKLLLRNAELGQLQAQINPHFIHNSYFLLHRMVRAHDWDHAQRFSRMIGTYFQYITNSSLTAALSDEIEHAYIYAELQAKRFDDRVDVELAPLPEQYRDLPVPKLILQPILENVFKYAFHDHSGIGLLTVRFIQNEQTLVIQVEDNGEHVNAALLDQIKKKLDQREGVEDSIGLVNIHRRLQLHFGDDSGLSIDQASIGGLQVKVNIVCPSEVTACIKF